MLSRVDKNGNLYLEKDKSYTLIGGYNLNLNNELDINVVAIKNLSNEGKFGDSGYLDVANAAEAGVDLAVEAKFKIGKYGENDFDACGDLLKLLDPSDKTIALVRLNRDGSLADFVYNTSTTPTVGDSLGVSLSQTEWTTVKVVCHFLTNTKDIYINGTLVKAGAKLLY